MADIAVRQDPQLLELNPPLVQGQPDLHDLTEKICGIVEGDVIKTPLKYWITLSITASITGVLLLMLVYLVATGIGVWGNNRPVGWAWDITNFVFWIGIGHAGTLISAILFLFRQKWRTSINRSAEAMTLFAVMCAAIFPLFHTGRPWRAFYWLFPIPNTDITMWQNFRSPLIWDVFAVSTYLTVSILFWYTGLVPDVATMRDRATKKVKQVVFAILSLGWRGSARHWRHYELAYLILAGLSTPLVLSVHSVVSFDFATSVIPGWHTTIFPPYFVAGAVFSGFACVMTLLIIARWTLNLHELITIKHLENMNKIILVTGSIVGYAYATELFMAWYSGNVYERFAFLNRATGPYWWAYWIMVSCNVISPQFYWIKAMRRSIPVMFVLSLVVNVGMWFERFVIIATSLHRDFVPSSWGYFRPTIVDISTFIGTIGLFLTLFLLFARFLPMIALSEVKAVRSHEKHTFAAAGEGGHH
ncbi:MAG TPA: NrfD/PsrC family molybdoenzyme membrane anchor subunit [Bryobacteraceae bacterium]|jgi:molybdopterin-containing oxidoreductase family membrane subunit|nr:NrfD/PsrC family molybdoenzyme membrane anchor subunit [Bryobacteraceae bacterium]